MATFVANSQTLQAGWGKRPAYVLAAAATGVTDVTRRYTASFAKTLARRTLCAEALLVRACALVTSRLRAALPADRRAELIARDNAEEAELAQSQASGACGAQLAGLPGACAARLASLVWAFGRQQRSAPCSVAEYCYWSASVGDATVSSKTCQVYKRSHRTRAAWQTQCGQCTLLICVPMFALLKPLPAMLLKAGRRAPRSGLRCAAKAAQAAQGRARLRRPRATAWQRTRGWTCVRMAARAYAAASRARPATMRPPRRLLRCRIVALAFAMPPLPDLNAPVVEVAIALCTPHSPSCAKSVAGS